MKDPATFIRSLSGQPKLVEGRGERGGNGKAIAGGGSERVVVGGHVSEVMSIE